MRLTVLGSGSKGNAILLEEGSTRLLIDAGFGPKTLERRLHTAGVAASSVEAVIITHEHIDHCTGARQAAARWGWRILATRGTLAGCASLGSRGEAIPQKGSFQIGDIQVETLPVSHDAAEPIGILATARAGGFRAAILHDLGILTDELLTAIADVNLLVLEANHDGQMLRNGPYSLRLQRRVAGRYGHLSNTEAARGVAMSVHRRLERVVLAHLSETNNTPALALAAVMAALRRTGFRGEVSPAAQRSVGATFAPNRTAYPAGGQLSLAL